MNDQVQEVRDEVIESPATAQENAETPSDETEASKEVKEAQAIEAKTFTQEEVDRIAQKERNKAERKIAREYEAKLEAERQRAASVEPAKKSNDAPRIEDYTDVAEYLDARDAWRDRQRDAVIQEQKAQESQREIAARVEKIYAKADKIDGFDREVFDSLPIFSDPKAGEIVATAIMECDDAPRVMAYLANNPEEAERIADLKPSRQAAEIVKIEESLAAKKPVAVSKAPAPVKTVGARGGHVAGNPETMNQKEFEAWLYGKK